MSWAPKWAPASFSLSLRLEIVCSRGECATGPPGAETSDCRQLPDAQLRLEVPRTKLHGPSNDCKATSDNLAIELPDVTSRHTIA
jgi:hypothetical protein